ncbi:peptidase domain-containing ABC transporter [Mucilaginibacter robiniae]|uniref:Peptidase domain-containing ABC transporter n=1 Tax=Mucilaginibacter robiniae TaxID=2728022 RepID=A0A7L5E5X0_9SPHI|nr:peptidase domain-containing ABC transporter [Mucilaginibacter robiniae]QJD96253.1 peptidase domain-containing ABC transporter [Mucilaginibacter robiniae]
MGYPFYRQLDSFDCGPTCLKMIAEFFGKKYSLEFLREASYITREGVSLLGVSQAAEKIGFRTLMVKVTLNGLKEECPLPVILHWNQEHFVVLYRIQTSNGFGIKNKTSKYLIADPSHGITKLSEDAFMKYWHTNEKQQGIALLIEPTAAFYAPDLGRQKNKSESSFLLSYLRPFKLPLLKLLLCMGLSVGITITLPFLTKGLIDRGVLGKSYNLILLFIGFQMLLYISSSILDILRSWLLLHMNAKISLNIISDFLKKMMLLPISFFDSKSVGDVSQRISDHHRIEVFLTTEIINTLFSFFQVLILSTILLSYKPTIWATFISFSAIGVIWIILFQNKRKKMDYLRFQQGRTAQEKLYELVVGMQEIKLYGSETEKRWEWEHLQMRQYRLNINSLKLEQFQQSGFIFFTQFKNILISYLAATAVLHGGISLGVMLSISFIIGQTNGPLQQLTQFFKSGQDAKLSFSRLQEIHVKDDEEVDGLYTIQSSQRSRIYESLHLNAVGFQYQGPRSPFVLRNVSITIPRGKTTAIVGASGSGKTTLLKILLGFYKSTQGEILVGEDKLAELSPKWWRSQCGTVMQDGYVFNDTIARNIVVDGKTIDTEKFKEAIRVSNVEEFVNQLPLKYNTKIGTSGMGLSGGQKQRILIARAVYKNPEYLFFDEATSNLDSTNETEIMDNLNEFFLGRTVVIIAHRLSTVKNADQIIVMEKGRIVEVGTHMVLTTNKGAYYKLVKDQLELDV